MSRAYSFETNWYIKAPVKAVWDAIYQSQYWPQWWKGVLSVEEKKAGYDNGIGGIRVYKMRSPMLYTLSFDMELAEYTEYKILKGYATGDLEGVGIWHFEEQGDITHVRYNWDVKTNKAWMNALSFALKPIFEYNHDAVMRRGAESLAKKLNTELIAFE